MIVIFEGTTTVKSSKIQRLMTDFETITMKEDESFDTFHSMFKDIVNSLCNLGEIIFESRVVKKILWSLPDRFLPKLLPLKKVRIWFP